ncbi:YihY/virulence factor BrkB family protein [Nocardioides sp. W3-2-3]|nr:YihY/virulence factor BrkB family protein [Nocardioides convexus]
MLGVVLMVSVSASSVLTRMSKQVLDWLHLGEGLGWLVTILALVFGLAASALLFFLMFRILAKPPVPSKALWSGAWLGAIGFEVLKQALRRAAGQHPRPAGLPGLRHRADPAGLDQLLLPRRALRRRVVVHAPAGPSRAGRPPRRTRLGGDGRLPGHRGRSRGAGLGQAAGRRCRAGHGGRREDRPGASYLRAAGLGESGRMGA